MPSMKPVAILRESSRAHVRTRKRTKKNKEQTHLIDPSLDVASSSNTLGVGQHCRGIESVWLVFYIGRSW
jgi:hypothetical protein